MFWEIFCDLCKSHGTTPTTVSEKLSLSSANVTYWKNGRKPRIDILSRIANYFGVSVDYLLGNTEKGGVGAAQGDFVSAGDKLKGYSVPVFESVSAGLGAYASSKVNQSEKDKKRRANVRKRSFASEAVSQGRGYCHS